MKKILIYDTSDNGHHIEYIHHLHEAAAVENGQRFFVFVVPIGMKEKGRMLHWSKVSHISFRYLSEDECNIGNGWTGNYNRAIAVRKIVKEEHPDEVVFITLMAFMPFLALLPSYGVKYSGIIYSIYLYHRIGMSWMTKAKNSFVYYLLSHLDRFRHIYILNDDESRNELNKMWKTQKFVYLPDPVAIPDIKESLTRPEQLPDRKTKTIFLHAGGMDERKGTMTIFDIISRLSSEQKKKVCFVFAGVVTQSIRDKFYSEYTRLKDECEIIVFDEFCSFELLTALCKYSSYLLLPYKNTTMSSGVIAYGAYCNTPVIVPNSGLLGKLVRHYQMGICIEGKIFEKNFLDRVDDLCTDWKPSKSDYVVTHSVKSFTQVILMNDDEKVKN